MELDEAKRALISKVPVIVSSYLLGDVFQGKISGITMRAPYYQYSFGIETTDAITNSVMVSDIKKIRYATEAEIEAFKRRKNIIGEIKPNAFYESRLHPTVFGTIRNMSIYDMAVFLTKTYVLANKEQGNVTDDSEVFNECLKTTLKFLESEVTECQPN